MRCDFVTQAGERWGVTVLRYYAIESHGLKNLKGSGLTLGEHTLSAVKKGNESLILAINEGLPFLATGAFKKSAISGLASMSYTLS